MKPNIDLLTVLIGLLTLFTPLSARADDPPPEPIEIALEINSLDLGVDVGTRLEGKLYAPMADILKSKAFEVQGPGGAPITVRTTLSHLDEGDSNYAVHIDFIDEHGDVTPLIEDFECRACSEKRLLEQTLKGFRLSMTQLHGMVGAPPPELAPPPQLPPAPMKRIGPLGYTGIGVSSGGLLMVVVGTGLLASQSSQNSSADAVLSVGIAALSLGLAAIIGDVVHRRRTSERHRPRIQPAPLEAGLAFSFGL